MKRSTTQYHNFFLFCLLLLFLFFYVQSFFFSFSFFFVVIHLLISCYFCCFFSYFFSSAPTTKINGQTPPLDVTGLSQNEIQALLLGSHPSTQNISVKREPEDLRKDPKSTRNQKVMRI